MKVGIRTVISNLVGRSSKELRLEISDLEGTLNELQLLKATACSLEQNVSNKLKLLHISDAINRVSNDIGVLWEKQSSETAFRARAKWYDLGEKSNKYFLNLNKKPHKQKVLSEIICDGTNYQGQDGVSEGITSFYKKLYRLNDSGPDRDQGFSDLCPEISQHSRFTRDAELTDAEYCLLLWHAQILLQDRMGYHIVFISPYGVLLESICNNAS